MSEVVLTDRYDRKAAAVPGAVWDRENKRVVFYPESTPKGIPVAMRLFPETTPELSPYYHPDEFPRPIDYATPFYKKCTDTRLHNVGDYIRDAMYEHQKVDVRYGVEFCREYGGVYYAWDMGLGKTLAAIATWMELDARKVVVVCGNTPKTAVWEPDIKKWVGDTYRIYNVSGSRTRRDNEVREFATIHDPAILMIHYQALRLVDPKQIGQVDVVVVDEAHRLANGGPSQSSRVPQFFKALKKIDTQYKIALSGTVINNTAEDFFGAQHWLFPERYASRWRDWNNRYLEYVDNPVAGKVYVGVLGGRIDDLRNEVGAFTLVRNKTDELPDLPDKIKQDLYVELSPQQRKVYNEMVERLIAELPDGEKLTAVNVLDQLTKLRRIAAGLDAFVPDVKDSAKFELAQELVEDNFPGKSLIFTWHKDVAHAMAERLRDSGISCLVIDGDVKIDRRTELCERFQNDDYPRVLIGTMATVGESLTLHRANNVIFVEMSWVPRDMAQAEDRVHRIGQEQRVTVTNLVARDTIDEQRLLPTVTSKDQLRRSLLGKGG